MSDCVSSSRASAATRSLARIWRNESGAWPEIACRRSARAFSPQPARLARDLVVSSWPLVSPWSLPSARPISALRRRPMPHRVRLSQRSTTSSPTALCSAPSAMAIVKTPTPLRLSPASSTSPAGSPTRLGPSTRTRTASTRTIAGPGARSASSFARCAVHVWLPLTPADRLAHLSLGCSHVLRPRAGSVRRHPRCELTGSSNIQQANSANLLPSLGLNTADYNLGASQARFSR